MSYAQTIFNRLRRAGMTEAGALGMLGNFQCESGCEPGRVQGDFSPYRNNSKAYVKGIEDGSISREKFAKDQKGFGLAQWTYYTRKYALYDYWQNSGRALDSAELQSDFALHELTTEPQYTELWQFLKTTTDVFTSCSRICRVYEQPYYNNIDARFQAAQTIKAELDLNAWETEQPTEPPADQQQPQPAPGGETIPATEYWPPRMICKGMEGADVAVLQAVLYARGYMVAQIDGQFGSYLEETVKTFQKSYSLDVDGIVGNQTWGKLLERR